MTKNIYRFKPTLISPALNDFSDSSYFYKYCSEAECEELDKALYKEFTSFDEFYNYAQQQPLFSDFFTSETLFRKTPFVGLYCGWCDNVLKITEKNFKKYSPIVIKLNGEKCCYTIKEIADCLSADDFIQFCADRGLSFTKELIV